MWYTSIFLVVVGADQVTKYWIAHSLELYASRQIIPGLLSLTYARNTGVAFSMFAHSVSSWSYYLFITINVVAVAGFTLSHFRMQRHPGYSFTWPFALIASGAAGNVIDRVRYGSVVDFIDVYVGNHHWPTFNVADSAICTGVALFLYLNLIEEKKKSQQNNGSNI